MISYYAILLFLMVRIVVSADIDILVIGNDNGIKSTKQADYNEALMDAKLRAIERSGIKLMAETTIMNLSMKSDYIESKSEGVLKPGFQILDIGYQIDGRYLVILSGKVVGDKGAAEADEKFNLANLYLAQGELYKAEETFGEIVDKYPSATCSQSAYLKMSELMEARLFKHANTLIEEKEYVEALKVLSQLTNSSYHGTNYDNAINLYNVIEIVEGNARRLTEEAKQQKMIEARTISDSFTGERLLYREDRKKMLSDGSVMDLTYTVTIVVSKVGKLYDSRIVACISSTKTNHCEEHNAHGIYPVIGSNSSLSMRCCLESEKCSMNISFQHIVTGSEFQVEILQN